MKAVVLAAGPGTRLRPHTHTGPKHMLPVANKPVMQYIVEKLASAEIREIIFIVGYREDAIMEHFENGEKFGVKIDYVKQDKRLGLAHAVGLARGLVGGEPFVVILGDNLFNMPFSKIMDLHLKSKAPCSVAISRVDNPQIFGVVKIEGDRIVDLVEKPKDPPTNYAIAGIYFFSEPELVFDAIDRLKPSSRGEYEITDALKLMLSEGTTINPIILEGYWKDTGLPEDLLEANKLVLGELKSTSVVPDNVTTRGPIQIGRDVKFIGEVILRGPTIIGDGCTVDSCVLGPYVSIGDNSTMSVSVLSNSIVLDGCEMTETVLENSIVGRYCTIRPKKSGRPRMVVGDHSMVEI